MLTIHYLASIYHKKSRNFGALGTKKGYNGANVIDNVQKNVKKEKNIFISAPVHMYQVTNIPWTIYSVTTFLER